MKPPGVILAGGRSTRMGGGDKCLLPLLGRPVLDHVIDRLQGQVSGLLLNANGDPSRFSAFGLATIADSDTGFAGPLAGVLAGMDYAAAQGAEMIVTVAADTPFFPADLVARLVRAQALTGLPIAMAASGGDRHPTFALWPVNLRAHLRQALAGGTRKIVGWSDPIGCMSVEFASVPFDPFFNINTPDDLLAAERLAAGPMS